MSTQAERITMYLDTARNTLNELQNAQKAKCEALAAVFKQLEFSPIALKDPARVEQILLELQQTMVREVVDAKAIQRSFADLTKFWVRLDEEATTKASALA